MLEFKFSQRFRNLCVTRMIIFVIPVVMRVMTMTGRIWAELCYRRSRSNHILLSVMVFRLKKSVCSLDIS